jgi:hypothetical protein
MAGIRFKRQRLSEYLILVPIIWLSYIMIFSSSGENEKYRPEADEDILNENVLEENDDVQGKENSLLIDNDHPEEERKKAEIQEKDVQGNVQLNAPVEVNPNQPGYLSKLVDFM